MKKGFTLAEIMIVLSVIAVLTAILLPSARNATPHEDLMKFKKAHLLLINTMQELVNSDKYYADGMLDTKANGQKVDSPTYFCNTFADVIGNVKSLNCKDRANPPNSSGYAGGVSVSHRSNIDDTGAYGRRVADSECTHYAPEDGDEITLANGVTIYTLTPGNYFGHPAASQQEWYKDENGLRYWYRVLCIDIDGTPENVAPYKCVNQCPFGYGIRIDGKVLLGARATEWFKKTIQEK